MRTVALLTPNYPPETNAAAKRIHALARHLAAGGWDPTVITLMPNYPQAAIYPGYDRTSPSVEVAEGVTVVRVRPWLVPRDRMALRFASELLFSLQALIHVLRRAPRLVLASSPYMMLGPTALLGARARGVIFAWDVRDLTWQYMRATGKRSYGLDAALERLMRWTARHADVLTTATHGQLAYFEAPPGHSATVPNGVDDAVLEALAPMAREAETRRRGPGDRVKVTYAGLLGYPQALSSLIDAMHELPKADLIVVGEGTERSALTERARGLSNVTFTGHCTWPQLQARYADADILVAHLRDDPAFAVAQPSKLWEYMATGRPVIYAGTGEAAEILHKHGIGVVVPPEDPRALAEAIRGLAADPERAAALGRCGRAFVEEHRHRPKLMRELVRLLDDVVPAA